MSDERTSDIRQKLAVPTDQSIATARTATPSEITGEARLAFVPQENLWLGSLSTSYADAPHIKLETLLGYEDKKHRITFASTRSGKGTSAIIPTLLTHPGSVVVLDPKGENATITARHRAKKFGHKIVVLDPFKVADVPDQFRGKLNPLQWLSATDDSAIDGAKAITESIIVASSYKDNFWDKASTKILTAVICYVRTSPYFEGQRDLITVAKLCIGGDREGKERQIVDLQKQLDQMLVDLETADTDEEKPSESEIERLQDTIAGYQAMSPMRFMLKQMAKSDAYDGWLKTQADSLLDTSERTFADVKATLETNLEYFTGKAMTAVLRGRSTFDVTDIRSTGAVSLYLCLPADDRLANNIGWLRVMINQVINTFSRMGNIGHDERQVLFILDEFASLKHMATMQNSIAYMAGFGVKIWSIFQDLQQLKTHYPDSWTTFISNAGCIQAWGVTDPETTGYLSARMGRTEIQREVVSRGVGTSKGTGTSSTTSDGTSTGTSENMGLDPTVNRPDKLMHALVRTGEGLSSGESHSVSVGETSSHGESTNETTSTQFTQANLANPDEIAIDYSPEKNNQLVFLDGFYPMTLDRLTYHECDFFQDLLNGTDKWSQHRKDASSRRQLYLEELEKRRVWNEAFEAGQQAEREKIKAERQERRDQASEAQRQQFQEQERAKRRRGNKIAGFWFTVFAIVIGWVAQPFIDSLIKHWDHPHLYELTFSDENGVREQFTPPPEYPEKPVWDHPYYKREMENWRKEKAEIDMVYRRKPQPEVDKLVAISKEIRDYMPASILLTVVFFGALGAFFFRRKFM